MFSPLAILGWMLCLVLLASDEWVLGPALFLLLAGWRILSREGGPPVVQAAFTFQWLQVTVALVYLALSGRRIGDLAGIDYRPMVMIGLASIAAYFGAYYLTIRAAKSPSGVSELHQPGPRLSGIAIAFVVALVVSLLLQRVAWSLPAITQILFMLSFVHYCLLYVLMTRLLRPTPRWSLIALVLCLELAIGFTGYFASFREPLVFIGLAILGATQSRRASTWIAAGSIVAVTFFAAVAWTTIKPILRKDYSYSSSTADRFTNVLKQIGPALRNPATGLNAQVDRLVSRVWMVRFPAIALERVPSVVPHEGGRLLAGAVSHSLMPRLFFPDKGVLPSESDKVRKYTGIWVAGRERQTSFAFGYVAESYVDFAWPIMLVPIAMFGALLGMADRTMRKVLRNPDILNGVRIVVLWSSMYLFEQSWVMMIGTTASLFVVLVGGGVMFERAFVRSARPGYPRALPLRESFVFAALPRRRVPGDHRESM